MSQARNKTHYVSNRKGWDLELKQCHPPKRINKQRRPILIIPGYGMNTYIFGFHPSGLSMESYFARRGFEVWTVNLRGQGGSKCKGGSREYSLKSYALEDLKTAINYVEKNSTSEAGKVDLIGCSLGGTLSYVYAALIKRHKAGALVTMGSPLRWEKVHPALRLLVSSPRLLKKIPVYGTQELLRTVFDKAVKSRFVKLYLHPEMVDLSDPEPFIQTVEDPSRHINAELAEWVKHKDLYIDDINITEAFKKVKNPLLCVLANKDGIVPPMSALSAEEVSGSAVKDTLVVGTDKLHFAHADLFVSNHSHDLVFKPVADWLLSREYTDS